MRVGALIDELRATGHEVDVKSSAIFADLDVHDVVHDSRAVEPEMLFCAVPGAIVDGHDFVDQAFARGARVAMVERFVDAALTQVKVGKVRRAMPDAAAAVHRRPSDELDVVGVTGTNGKTTTTHLLASIMRTLGARVEVIGTLSGAHTTPEATDFQRAMRRAVDDGTDVIAAEVSSHALDQHRPDATSFAIAAFSNLTPDHLDYHVDMDSYFSAKCRLFDGRARHELINVDDPWGARLAQRRPRAVKIRRTDAPISAADLDGSRFRWRGYDLHLPIAGEMNVANALMAAEAAVLLGASPQSIAAGLETVPQVPGRMERVRSSNDRLTVIVDYSHTPDSIEHSIAAIRTTARRVPITIVFGCGGDRDRTKRALMGRAAEAADQVVVTSDNPRSENPGSIIDDAVAGMAEPAAALIEPDRRAAIRLALETSAPGSVVLIAGKGHERTQTIGSDVLPFDDVAVAVELLEDLA